MSEYPVQVSKVQAPPLREETLARDRLLEWLSVRIHRRAVLLIAEAGYGKTTLLADFSRRTRLRVLWFRLDRGDRDWVGFLAYLVAAVRIHVPEFGSSTSALLRETAAAAPPLDTVLETFMRELASLPNEPSALVFDDFHLVDDAPEIRHILRELLTRGPERMSFVFASRREPPIRLARLRALGEVAELGTNDLRFDAAETAQLFSETYEMRLEPAVLVELNRRTEGWPASLQLVRAAIHDRDPAQVRSFISSLSGAEGHLYEYLAEEVVGELPADLQQFLMRTSVLETVDLVLGPIAADVSEAEARGFIDDGERHGLFGRGGPHTRHVMRAHPLVRDFLQARLLRAIGEKGIRAVHMRVAIAAEPSDWRTAARHYIAAGAEDDARRILSGAIEVIVATGAFATAAELVSSFAGGGLQGPPGLILRSRIAQQRAAVLEGLDLAEQAWAIDRGSTPVLLNLVAARTLAGDVAGAIAAGGLLEQATHSQLAALGRVYQRTMETSVKGSLEIAIREIDDLSAVFRDRGESHYLGVALLNAAYIRTTMGNPSIGLAKADESIALLAATSAGVDLVAARLARAGALAFIGDMDSARLEMDLAVESASPGQTLEVFEEIATIETLVGEASRASTLIDRIAIDLVPTSDLGEQGIVARILLNARGHRLEAARADLHLLRHREPRSSVAFEARRHLARGLVLALDGDPAALDAIQQGTGLAHDQHAHLWARYGLLLGALANSNVDPSPGVVETGRGSPVVLSMLAELVLGRLKHLDESARDEVTHEAERRPTRWRSSTRRLLKSEVVEDRQAAATLLEAIGEVEDIQRLRDASRGMRDRRNSKLGVALARRLANRVMVEDLGRVHVTAGGRTLDGGEIRRKVLALLCLLVSKPRFGSTREEVVDRIWPDTDPTQALNSLNQTVYFLRRVFEPDYVEDTSPGYVGQDGETIWLDPELVDARSRRCFELIRSMPGQPTPEGALALAEEYRGRFALDFAYEEWSAQYRDALHAGYLRVMERAIRIDLDTGHFERGTFLAERAAEIDPDSEEIQVALVRLYRLSGAHAAAAEQYGRYSQVMRDLGVEPLAISDI